VALTDNFPVSVAERTRSKREIEGGSEEIPRKDGSAQPVEERAVEEFEDDGSPWYFGKAREDLRRRRQGGAGRAAAAEEDDPVEVSATYNLSPHYLIFEYSGHERGGT